MPEIMFSNCKCEILNHFYFGPNFPFWGTALGNFSQCFFFNFSSLANHGGQHFYSAAHHKKASYGSVFSCFFMSTVLFLLIQKQYIISLYRQIRSYYRRFPIPLVFRNNSLVVNSQVDSIRPSSF